VGGVRAMAMARWGYVAEGIGIGVGCKHCKGGIEEDLCDEFDWEVGPDVGVVGKSGK
jgi:hypothetical protein